MDSYIKDGRMFSLHYAFQNDNHLRGSFNRLAHAVFGVDFESWYQEGLWKAESCIPYALTERGEVVAGLTVNVMSFRLNNQKHRYIQLGTVMTAPSHRGLGLSRFLMETVLANWQDRYDGLFLFANDSVLRYYPKFGFEKSAEYQYSQTAGSSLRSPVPRQMNINSAADRLLLSACYQSSNPFSAFSSGDNYGVLFFNLSHFFADCVYFIQEFNVVVVAEYNGRILNILDIYGQTDAELDAIVSAMAKDDTQYVRFGFTPQDSLSGTASLVQEEDTTLFWFSGKENPFAVQKLMFPVLSHT